jgi:hypothetical protein
MVLVFGLQPGQSGRGQLDDQRVRHDPAPPAGPGMREDRHPAGLPDQPDRPEDVDVVLGQPVPLTEPVRGERLGRGADQSGPDQRLRDVWPADRTATRTGQDLRPAHVDAVGAEQVHDPFPA